MNILVNQSKESYNENDVVIVSNFINETTQNEIYNNLLKEMEDTNIDNDNCRFLIGRMECNEKTLKDNNLWLTL
jgi:hypothetical protein